MNGAGSQEDPYVVTNWDELFEACAQAGKYVNIETDLDGNNYNNGILGKGITMNCSLLDGKGHTIKNIIGEGNYHILAQKSGNNTEIKNLNFENIYSLNSFTDVYCRITFNECILKLNVYSFQDEPSNPKLKFIKCSLFCTQSTFNGGKVYFELCNVYIKFTGSGSNFGASDSSRWTTIGNAKDSRIEIYIPEKRNLKKWYISDFVGCIVSIKSDSDESEIIWMNDKRIDLKTSVFNVSGIKNKLLVSSYPTEQTEDITDEYITENGAYFVSEDKMKSKEYLKRIGFVVE